MNIFSVANIRGDKCVHRVKNLVTIAVYTRNVRNVVACRARGVK